MARKKKKNSEPAPKAPTLKERMGRIEDVETMKTVEELGGADGLTMDEGADNIGTILERQEAAKPEGLLDDMAAGIAELEGQDPPDPEDSDGEDSEDSEDDGEGPEPEAPSKYHAFSDEELDLPVEVKVRGAKELVPLREVVEGYSRQEDYTRKTMELAEQRKEVKSTREQLNELSSAYQTRLEALAAGAARMLGPQQWQALQQEYARVKGAQSAVGLQTLESEHEAMKEALGWTSDEDVQKGSERLLKGALEYGYQQSELEGLSDHRALLILNDALETRERRGKAGKAKQAARKSRRKGTTLKPGVPDRSGRHEKSRAKGVAKARERLAKSGSIDDAVDALAGIFK